MRIRVKERGDPAPPPARAIPKYSARRRRSPRKKWDSTRSSTVPVGATAWTTEIEANDRANHLHDQTGRDRDESDHPDRITDQPSNHRGGLAGVEGGIRRIASFSTTTPTFAAAAEAAPRRIPAESCVVHRRFTRERQHAWRSERCSRDGSLNSCCTETLDTFRDETLVDRFPTESLLEIASLCRDAMLEKNLKSSWASAI